MTCRGNVAAKQSTKEVEGDDKMKTLECLRGRLLEERAVSRAANEEANKLGNKLIELENKLKEEVKLRKRAEKRLRSLTKKVESMRFKFESSVRFELGSGSTVVGLTCSCYLDSN